MFKVALKESIKIFALTLVAMLVGAVAYVAFVQQDIWNVIVESTFKLDVNKLGEVLFNALTTPVGMMPIIVFIITMFGFVLGFILSIINLMGGVEITPGEKPKKEKPKKEKKKKEKKKKEKEEPAAPTKEEETFVDTGNRCQICGKPIPIGRAICKNCEAILKGEAPPDAIGSSGDTEG